MTTVKLLGEGGVVWEFDLPLSEVYTDQVLQRKLIPDDDESREALASLLVPADEDAVVEEPPGELTLAERIRAVSSHAEANELAAELGVDGFEEKKPALDAKREQLMDAAVKAAE